MEVQFELDGDDQWAFTRYVILHSGWRGPLTLLGAGAFVVLTVWPVAFEGGVPGALLPVLGALLLLGLPLIWYLGLRYRTRRAAEADPSLTGWRAVSVGSDAITVQTAATTSRTAWSGVVSIEESDALLMFFTGPATAYLVPKRALPDAEQAAALVEQTRSYRERQASPGGREPSWTPIAAGSGATAAMSRASALSEELLEDRRKGGRGRQDKRRPFVVAALVVLGAAVVLGAPFWLVLEADEEHVETLSVGPGGDLETFALGVGQCGDLTRSEGGAAIRSRPCEVPHDFEVFYVGPSAAEIFDEMGFSHPPDPDAIELAAGGNCVLGLDHYAGEDWWEEHDIDHRMLVPSTAAWQQDDRTIRCLAVDFWGEKLHGSVRAEG